MRYINHIFQIYRSCFDSQEIQIHDVFNWANIEGKKLGYDYLTIACIDHVNTEPEFSELLSSYPIEWLSWYQERNFASIDPAIRKASASIAPAAWDTERDDRRSPVFGDALLAHIRFGITAIKQRSASTKSLISLSSSKNIAPTLSHHQSSLILIEFLMSVLILSIGAIGQAPENENKFGLTLRELDILKWTADGVSSRKIGDVVGISENTVNFHIKNILLKMDCSNKTMAACKAIRLGIV